MALRLTSVEGWICSLEDDFVRFGGGLAAVSVQRNFYGGFAVGSDIPLSIRSEAVPVSRITLKTLDSITYHAPAGRSLMTVMTRFPDVPVAARRFQIGSSDEMREVQSTGYNCDP